MVVQLRSYRTEKEPGERRGLWLEVQEKMITQRKRKGVASRRKQRLKGKQACEIWLNWALVVNSLCLPLSSHTYAHTHTQLCTQVTVILMNSQSTQRLCENWSIYAHSSWTNEHTLAKHCKFRNRCVVAQFPSFKQGKKNMVADTVVVVFFLNICDHKNGLISTVFYRKVSQLFQEFKAILNNPIQEVGCPLCC